jgi:FKBP-type peptidyl-prolyl cis-trans isomerase
MRSLTILLAVLVLVTAWSAWGPVRTDHSSKLDGIGDILGKAAEPKDVAEITVASWDDTTKAPQVFQVKKKGSSWIIPSHFDYPADGGTRVGKTAGVLGVKRGRLVTDDVKRHAELGVIDPTGEDAKTSKEHGRRITLKDQGAGTIIDIIVGKNDSDGGGGYFVREAGSAQVYTAKLSVDISTMFIDWVKPDLLQAQREEIRTIAIRDYSIDETSGTINQRSETVLKHEKTDADWTSSATPVGKKVKKTEIDTLLGELTGLRLAGIRPFELPWLQKRGFFLSDSAELMARPGATLVNIQGHKLTLFGNEGEVAVGTRDGVTYHLFFGQIALGDDADTAADSKAAETPKPAEAPVDPAAPPAPAKPEEAHNRYPAGFVSDDPEADLIAKEAAAVPAGAPNPGETAPVKPDLTKEHLAKAQKAQKRFQSFFYVIPDSTFTKLRPTVEALYEDLPPEPKARGTEQPISMWLAEHAKQPGVTTTASGLQYEILASGPADGKQPVDTNTVKVLYKGTRVDGVEFDASNNGPVGFGVTGVIKGWTEALKLMRVGDKWKLTIPPALAYGEAGQGDKIGPNEILQFEVELVAIE